MNSNASRVLEHEEPASSPQSGPALVRQFGGQFGGQLGPRLETGVVTSVLPLVIRMGEAEKHARCAKSCLVAPEAGDRVLCALEGDSVYVLAVLEGTTTSTRVAVPGELDIVAQGGRMSLRSPDAVNVQGGSAISMTSPKLEMRAASGSIAIDQLMFLGKRVMAEAGKVVVAARELDTLADRVVQRAKRVFRFVEDVDQTQAGTVDIRANSLLGLRGENAIVSARVMTKVDADQIHLG